MLDKRSSNAILRECSCPTGPARVSGRGPAPCPARAVELQQSANGGYFFVSEAARNRLKDALLKIPDQEAPRTWRANDILEKRAGVEANRQSVIEASLNCARVFLSRAKKLTENARLRGLKHSKPPLSPT